MRIRANIIVNSFNVFNNGKQENQFNEKEFNSVPRDRCKTKEVALLHSANKFTFSLATLVK